MRLPHNGREAVVTLSPFFLFILIILFFFWPAASLQGVFYFGDILRLHYPLKVAYTEALSQGQLPFWSPKVMFGFPIFAEGQVGALYPVNLVSHLLLPLPVALNYQVLFHYLWAASGTYLLCRALGLSRPSSALAGLAYSFSGFMTAHLTHINIVAVVSWLPWLLAVGELIVQKRKAIYAVFLALLVAVQFLPGHAQMSLLNLLVLSVYVVFRWFSVGIDVKATGQGLKPLLMAGLGVILGLGIAAAQLIPSFELLTLSQRAEGLDPGFYASFSLPPTRLAGFLIPFLWGDPLATLSPAISVEWVGYMGIFPLVVAFATLAVRRDRFVIFFSLMAFFSVLLALGRWLPLYPALFEIPVFRFFRVPARFLLLYSFAIAMLLGLGLDRLVSLRAIQQWKLPLSTVAIALASLTVLFSGVALLLLSDSLNGLLALWRYLPYVFLLASIALVLVRLQGRLSTTIFYSLGGLLLLVDLYGFSAAYNLTFNGVRPWEWLAARPRAAPVLDTGDQYSRVLTTEEILPDPVVMRESLYPNLAMASDFEGVGGYFPLALQRFNRLMELAEEQPRLLDLMGIEYILKPQLFGDDAKTESYNLTDPYRPTLLESPVNLDPFYTEAIQVESFVTQGVNLPDGALVAELVLRSVDGQEKVVPLLVGRDTGEWAYDRPDVRPVVKHKKPQVAREWPAVSTYLNIQHKGYTYRTVLPLESPIAVKSIQVRSRHPEGYVYLDTVVLIGRDSQRKVVSEAAGVSPHTLAYLGPEVAVFKNEAPVPRAFIVHKARVAKDEEGELSLLASSDFDPRLEIVLPQSPSLTGLTEGQAKPDSREAESAVIDEYSPTKVSIRARLASDGFLVLTDTYYPGWVALVDGKEQPILRADYLFRAIVLERGEHTVEFQYRPASASLGFAISLISLMIVALSLVVARWRRA